MERGHETRSRLVSSPGEGTVPAHVTQFANLTANDKLGSIYGILHRRTRKRGLISLCQVDFDPDRTPPAFERGGHRRDNLVGIRASSRRGTGRGSTMAGSKYLSTTLEEGTVDLE